MTHHGSNDCDVSCRVGGERQSLGVGCVDVHRCRVGQDGDCVSSVDEAQELRRAGRWLCGVDASGGFQDAEEHVRPDVGTLVCTWVGNTVAVESLF